MKQGILTLLLLITSEFNPSYAQPNLGARDCGDSIVNYREKYLTEFPTDSNARINFLNINEPCNVNAQVQFRAEMQQTYVTSKVDKTLDLVWKDIDVVWNNWRTNTADGVSGNRVCNPRRLLGCHETLRVCLCQQDFLVIGDELDTDHSVIEARPTNASTISHNKLVFRFVCKAIENSFCDWIVPWLFFCQVDCLGNQTCVGQRGSRTRKICRTCSTVDREKCQTDENVYEILHQNGAEEQLRFHWDYLYIFVTVAIMSIVAIHF